MKLTKLKLFLLSVSKIMMNQNRYVRRLSEHGDAIKDTATGRSVVLNWKRQRKKTKQKKKKLSDRMFCESIIIDSDKGDLMQRPYCFLNDRNSRVRKKNIVTITTYSAQIGRYNVHKEILFWNSDFRMETKTDERSGSLIRIILSKASGVKIGQPVHATVVGDSSAKHPTRWRYTSHNPPWPPDANTVKGRGIFIIVVVWS